MPKKKFPSGIAAIQQDDKLISQPKKDPKDNHECQNRKAGYVVEFIPKSLPYSNLTERFLIFWGGGGKPHPTKRGC